MSFSEAIAILGLSMGFTAGLIALGAALFGPPVNKPGPCPFCAHGQTRMRRPSRGDYVHWGDQGRVVPCTEPFSSVVGTWKHDGPPTGTPPNVVPFERKA